MNVTIMADDRAMALKALDLADKVCDQMRDRLDLLQLEDLGVKAFQGLLGSLRVALKNPNEIVHDLDFTHRRALGIALLVYRESLKKQRKGDEKLLITTDRIVRKLGEVSALLERLAGQETLFSRPIPSDVDDDQDDDGVDGEEEDLFDSVDGGAFESVDDNERATPPAPAGGTTRELDDAHI